MLFKVINFSKFKNFSQKETFPILVGFYGGLQSSATIGFLVIMRYRVRECFKIPAPTFNTISRGRRILAHFFEPRPSRRRSFRTHVLIFWRYFVILLIVWSNFVHISLKLASIFSQGEPVRRHREFAAGGRIPGARELREQCVGDDHAMCSEGFLHLFRELV